MSRNTPARITLSRTVRWCLALGLACVDQRRLTGSGRASEALHDDALYKSTYFTFYFFFTLQHRGDSAVNSARPQPAQPRSLLNVPNVTAYPSTASVPITVLLYSGQWDTCSLRGAIVNTGVLSITLTLTQNTYNMTIASLKVNTSPVRCCAVSICQ